MVTFELPWPPSVNHYWRRCGDRYFVTAKGKKFRDDVFLLCHKSRGVFNKESRLSVQIDAYPPDKRRRDLDNILKSLLDSLQHAGVYEDDYQIDEIQVRRNPKLMNKVMIQLLEINPN